MGRGDPEQPAMKRVLISTHNTLDICDTYLSLAWKPGAASWLDTWRLDDVLTRWRLLTEDTWGRANIGPAGQCSYDGGLTIINTNLCGKLFKSQVQAKYLSTHFKPNKDPFAKGLSHFFIQQASCHGSSVAAIWKRIFGASSVCCVKQLLKV